MTLDLWITPEETPALAAQATALIDARLARFAEAERAAFWASIRKAYNTPYNDPAPREVQTPRQPPKPVEIEVAERPQDPSRELAEDLSMPAIAAAALAATTLPAAHLAGEIHAA